MDTISIDPQQQQQPQQQSQRQPQSPQQQQQQQQQQQPQQSQPRPQSHQHTHHHMHQTPPPYPMAPYPQNQPRSQYQPQFQPHHYQPQYATIPTPSQPINYYAPTYPNFSVQIPIMQHQAATVPQPKVQSKPREKKMAVLKDPNSGQEVKLVDEEPPKSPNKSRAAVQAILQKASDSELDPPQKKVERNEGTDSATLQMKNSKENGEISTDQLDATPQIESSEDIKENSEDAKENCEDAKENCEDAKENCEDSVEQPDATNQIENSEDSKENVPEPDSIELTSTETVALTYEPGQFKPIVNIGGKKKYSLTFMKAVGETIPVPKQAGVVAEKTDMFAPSWQQQGRQDFGRHQYGGRSSAGQDKPRKIIAHSPSLNQEVELKTVSNPWKPSKEAKTNVPDDVTESEGLKKKFRSILNKLTPDNFDNLAKSVQELPIHTESKLADVIDIVFAKALLEPGYCVLYGRMCSLLKKISAGTANFGNTLLRRCQHQFQADIYAEINLEERRAKIEAEENAETKKQLSDELYEDMFRCRKRGLGLIKFIGELYKIEMLNDQIMFECVLRLLVDPTEESLECLCDLLVTIGEKLEKSRKSTTGADKDKKVINKIGSKGNAYTSGHKSAASVVAQGPREAEPTLITTLDQVFDRLHMIEKDKKLPLSIRIRFKILDTCELREKDHWQSKRTKDANLQKREEIREAHNEKLEQDKIKNARRVGRLGQSGGSSNQLSSLSNDSGNRGLHTSSSSQSVRDQESIPENYRNSASAAIKNLQHSSRAEQTTLRPPSFPSKTS